MEKLSKQAFLTPDCEEVFIFNSDAWGGALEYKRATVGQKERARRKARKGDTFDNAKYGCSIIQACLVFEDGPINDLEVDALRRKDSAEMDRLLDAITGEMDTKDPK